jgi:hypothetical protein
MAKKQIEEDLLEDLNEIKREISKFLLFAGFTSFAREQNVGRISLELRATEEEASPSRYYYYATFQCTLPRTYAGIETFIDEAEKLKLYPGSYFRATLI